MTKDETIAAIATSAGPGGIGVVRISGEGAARIFSNLFSPSNGVRSESHRMLHGWLIDPASGEKVDEGMACYMRGPKSYTGEDVAEFYCHGGMAVVQRALGLALAAGARLAQKGEFTKRAFLNGKIDLAQAEAVLDLVQAQTAAGAGYAVRQLEGRLSKAVNEIRSRLLGMLAELEAQIDFPEDAPPVDLRSFGARLKAQGKAVGGLLESAGQGRMFRQGLATVIIGKPNVGKSSLLNALLGEERAIVTDLPGTTRDAIEETINIGGLSLRVVDTAGIRHPRDQAEEFGVERAEKELKSSDFALFVLDASQKLDRMDREVLNRASGRHGILVLNKVDLGQKVKISEIRPLARKLPIFKISALYGKGITELKKGIFAYVRDRLGLPGKDAVTINARHQECLHNARNSLILASESCLKGLPTDFISIDVKGAAVALGEVTGELVSDEVIDTIFSQFCIGK